MSNCFPITFRKHQRNFDEIPPIDNCHLPHDRHLTVTFRKHQRNFEKVYPVDDRRRKCVIAANVAESDCTELWLSLHEDERKVREMLVSLDYLVRPVDVRRISKGHNDTEKRPRLLAIEFPSETNVKEVLRRRQRLKWDDVRFTSYANVKLMRSKTPQELALEKEQHRAKPRKKRKVDGRRGKSNGPCTGGPKDAVSVTLFNSRSLWNKLREFQLLLSSAKPDIVCVTETWLSDERPDSALTGGAPYTVFRCDRRSHGGGCAIFVHHRLTSFPVSPRRTSAFELSCVDVASPFSSEAIRIVCVYRPPNIDSKNDEKLQDEIATLLATEAYVIVCGDLNLPAVKWVEEPLGLSRNVNSSWNRFARDAKLKQYVTFPTRGESLLDLVFSNNDGLVSSFFSAPAIGASDHSVVQFRLSLAAPACTSEPWRCYRSCCFERLNGYFSSLDWFALLDKPTLQDMYDTFLATANRAVEEFVCMKPPKGSYEEFPAFIRKVNDYRISLWSQCNKPEVLEKYHQSTRKLRRLVLKFTRNKEKKMLRTKGSRDLFKHVARNVKTKSTCIALLADSGEQIRNDDDKVEALAEHFRSVYVSQTEGPNERAELHRCCRAKLAFLNFFEDDVYKAARKCPMSYTITPDGIPPILLRGCSKSLSLPLAIIFNCSMTTGIVPFQFKQSFITPIPKRPPAVAKNFRPISITSIVARTMERLVRRRLLDFLDEHNILPESQYGFRPKRSVRDALIGSIESWSKAIDANIPVDVIYFDFTAAFDKVQHNRLLHKLSSCGIDGYLLQWVRYFLTGRESKVRLGKTFSNAFEPTSSVPQGSVLGPLLFLVYVADLADVIVLPCILRCYADDVNISAEVRNDNDRAALQASVDNLVEWSVRNDLPLSVPKCYVLHLGSKNSKHVYTMDGKSIAEEVRVRDLGIIIASDLRSKTHVSTVVSKANSKLFLFLRLIKSNDPELLCRIFKVYVRPIVETCSSTFVITSKKEVEQLESVQRRFTKAAFTRAFPGEELPHYRDRCRRLELETLEERRIRSDLVLAKKILLGKCATKNHFHMKQSRTRGGASKFARPYSRTKMRESTFFVRVASTLSKLNTDFVLNSSLGVFKDFVKDLDLSDVCDLVF